MQYIKAPYNFVPVSDSVVFPEWGNVVSHDIPFKDGESGTIRVKIKAESPIFVRNGQSPKDMENSGPTPSFSKHKGRYFIPGSSIKGAIRNVLEIMSFGKMDRINNDRYAVRDFENNNLYPKTNLIKEVQAGWLYLQDGKYKLEDCGKPGRISHIEIDKYYQTTFRNFFLVGGGFKSNDEEHKSAKFKYLKIFGSKSLSNTFNEYKPEKENNVDPRRFFTIDPSGTQKGTLVFTGQAGPRKEPENGKASGKIYEFIFFEPKEPIVLPDAVIENFFFAYYEYDKTQWSKDWEWRREQLFAGEKIPVFFRKTSNGKIKDMGLSFLYKIAYENAVKEVLPENHKQETTPDFAETMLGYIQNTGSLKGRVHFSHAINTNDAQEISEQNEALSSPKASYYPNYIEQNIKSGKVAGDYQTFMYNNANLSGWKRYPVHKDGTKNNKGTENVMTNFNPLQTGAEFELAIRVHNLRKVEIGALLSALTFHKTPDTYHTLGMAKPLGYGKSSVTIEGFEDFVHEQEEYMKSFEAYITAKLGKWIDSEQIKELIAMATEQENHGDSALEYMKMDMNDKNEFVEAKKQKEALRRYTKLQQIQANSGMKSLLEENERQERIANSNQAIAKEKQEFATGESLEAIAQKKLDDTEQQLKNRFNESKQTLQQEVKDLLDKIEQDKITINKQIQRKKEEQILNQGLNLDEVSDYKNGKEKIEQYLKNGGKLNDEDYQKIKDFLKRAYANVTSKKEKRRWDKFNKWTLEKKWVGPDRAKEWFEEIINTK